MVSILYHKFMYISIENISFSKIVKFCGNKRFMKELRRKPWLFCVERSEKIERQRLLDLPILAGPNDSLPGEAQGASVASTMSVKLGVGVSQRRANI